MDATVETILKQCEEDRQWELYCAIASNPFAEDMGTFEEFCNQCNPGRKNKQRIEQGTEQEINKAQMEKQVQRAEKILEGFVPPEGGEP